MRGISIKPRAFIRRILDAFGHERKGDINLGASACLPLSAKSCLEACSYLAACFWPTAQSEVLCAVVVYDRR
jgi:hypothetical protein